MRMGFLGAWEGREGPAQAGVDSLLKLGSRLTDSLIQLIRLISINLIPILKCGNYKERIA